jgi:hypothetical protein
VHSASLGEVKSDEPAIRAFNELQAAVDAELKELGRTQRGWKWSYALLDDGFAVRAMTPEGFDLACLLDKKALRARIVGAATNPRTSAYSLVQRALGEIEKSRQALLTQRWAVQ